jgi:hypothetical protein
MKVANIKMDLKETKCEGVDWIKLAQKRVLWRVFINTIMDLPVPLGVVIS